MIAICGCAPRSQPDVSQKTTASSTLQATKKTTDQQAATASVYIEIHRDGAKISVDNKMLQDTTEDRSTASQKKTRSSTQTAAHETPSATRAAYVLVIGGILAAGAGLVLLTWLRMKALGIALIAAGASIAALSVIVEQLQVLLKEHGLLIFLGLLGAASLGLVIWMARRTRRQQITLDTITPAVKAAGQAAEADVRKQVKRKAGKYIGIVRSEIERSKGRVALGR